MQDIADRVGLNRNTVSNVLNGRLTYSRSDAAKRAEEIRRIAYEMGFRPSAAAKAIKSGSTGFIGMIRSPQFACSVHVPAFDSGIDDALHAHGLCLVRDIIDDANEPRQVEVPRIVREAAVDGILINYAFGTPPAIKDVLDRCRIPAVWINRKRETNCVRPNDEGAAYEATRHLVLHGHRDVRFVELSDRDEVGPALEDHYSRADRISGYERAMREAGLAPRIDTLPVPPYPAPGYVGRTLNAYAAYLHRADRPTAVLCANDGRVMVSAAWKLGLRVPQDLSVITFDNDVPADNQIAVDRVLVRYQAMGHYAVEELCQLINNPAEPRSPVVIPFEFHITGSVARPSDSA